MELSLANQYVWIGIIPRAAQLLFEKLDTPKHSRTQSSGLRTPARYSMSSPQSFNRNPVDKTWQLKATYVEVGLSFTRIAGLFFADRDTRSTTNNFEIYFSQIQRLLEIAVPLLSVKMPKAGLF